MNLKAQFKSRLNAARKDRRTWARLFDLSRLVLSLDGLAILWTRLVYRDEVHQTTGYTHDERYPEIFDRAAALAPRAGRLLSFGCATGEELIALRRRFAGAEIIGAEINPRSLRKATQLVAGDPFSKVVHPRLIEGDFDAIFALAVFQREPHKILESGIRDLSDRYPFERFDRAVCELAARLRLKGLFCIDNAHYRFEDSSIARCFERVAASPRMSGPLFGPDGRRLESPVAHTIFQKMKFF